MNNKNIISEICHKEHPGCFVCNNKNISALKLDFNIESENSVYSEFFLTEDCQGYKDILHGGIIATLLDSAMCHCLFAIGIVAVTVELNIRYGHPVAVNTPGIVRAKISKSHGPLYFLEASISQNDKTLIKSQGKFYRQKKYE